MISNENNYHEEQYGRRNHTDGNTSDDSLLLMADDDEDKTPLLNGTDHTLALREETLAHQSLIRSTHCHVPDDKFDYGARNRLILVLIICILFVGIEIAGIFLH